jgi:isoleucyl-tRNA synthetase
MDSKYLFEEDKTFHKHEETIMKLWDVNKTYTNIRKYHMSSPKFIMMDGPPFVSGNLHSGHIAISTIKSIISNYKTMKNFDTHTTLGYDCHGLPIESKVCAEQNIKSLEEIKEMGIGKFNQLCDETITKYSDSWRPLFTRLGRLTDFDDTYMTRDKNFMESCMFIFKNLFDKDLVYRGNKVMAYSYQLNTPLSNFEASQNYKEKTTNTVYAKFKKSDEDNTYFVAWTTTPWTLTMNMALCINRKYDYCKIQFKDDPDILIVEKNSIKNLCSKKKKTYDIIDTISGKDLIGVIYEPIFDYVQKIKSDFVHKIIEDGYVKNDGIGTGIVHQAPAFGSDDYNICEKNDIIDNVSIDLFCPVSETGCFTLDDSELNGNLVFDCDKYIIKQLETNNNLYKTHMYKHQYPYCYRTDTPLIYKTTTSLFIKVTELKDRMAELNKTVNWYPKTTGEIHFQNWIENAKDWAVSRYRFYGTPIPIWVNDKDENDMICIGSVDELLEQGTIDGKKIETLDNLHPEYVNDIKIIKDGNSYSRIPDIFDCWFESGAVPFAQLHYPFTEESKVIEDREFLSDFVCEGIDQTRGWFYTLLVLSTAVLDKAPYRNVMCMGLVLDENGQKISKKYGNFENPMDIIDNYGSDALRTYIASSPIVRGESLKFSKTQLYEVKGKIVKYINIVKYFTENAGFYEKEFEGLELNILEKSENLFDRWIIEKSKELICDTNKYMESYEINKAILGLLDFIEIISTEYVIFNRKRFRGSLGKDEQKKSLNTLFHIIKEFNKLISPFMPFTSEYIFKKLSLFYDESSTTIFLTNYPKDEEYDIKLLGMVKDLQSIVQMTKNLRCKSKNHRQAITPFKEIGIYHESEEYLKSVIDNIQYFKDDINYNTHIIGHLDDTIDVDIKLNLKEIGKKFKKESKIIKEYLTNIVSDQELLKNCKKLGTDIIHDKLGKIPKDCFELFYKPKVISDDKYSAIFDDDTQILVRINHEFDEEINFYKQMRLIFSGIQQKRKFLGLKSWNKINIVFDTKLINNPIFDSMTEIYKKEFSVIESMSNLENTHIMVGDFSNVDELGFMIDEIAEINGCTNYYYKHKYEYSNGTFDEFYLYINFK